MFEIETDTRLRHAMRAAHKARGDVLRQAWIRLFG